LIWQGHNSWISAFKDTINKSSLQKPKAICYNQIPDIVESLLGAAFLCEHKLFSSKHQYTVIGFLDQLRLPMHVDCVGDERNRWFKHPHACIGGGFDFNTNEAWRKQFEQILETFHSEVYIKQRLSTGVDNLLSLFRGLNPSAELRLCADMKMVMACALFNDSLESDSDDSLQGNPPILLARFRKNLFFIGEAALHLALAMECHRRYPLASASDLHLLKVCCIADDAISYIVMKAGIHHFLYDQESDHRQVQSFKVMVDEADKNGRKAWDRCHGWVLGRGEFAKRWKRRWWANGDGGDPPSLPRYAGLGGGCLYGQDRKVGELVYKQLVYSFKSIIGSMVIAVGLDNMWNIAVSLFEEILLLSPEETRACYKNSITSTYSPGKKSQSVQRANSLKARYGTGWSGVT
jgi:dsRNA-specific ribonuclease